MMSTFLGDYLYAQETGMVKDILNGKAMFQSKAIMNFQKRNHSYSNNWSPTVKRKCVNEDYPNKKRKYYNIQSLDSEVNFLEDMCFPCELIGNEIEMDDFEKLNLDCKLNGIEIALQNNAPFCLKIISFFNKYYKERREEMIKEDILNCNLINHILTIISGFISVGTSDPLHINEYIMLLGLLSRCNKGREYIISQGGLNKIVALLVQYKDNHDVFSSCLLAFGNLINTIQDVDEQFSKLIEEGNIVKILIDSMQSSQYDTEISQLICFVLGNLVFIGYDESVLKENCIKIVIDSVINNLSNPAMLTEAIFLFKNLAYNEDGRIKLMEHKVLYLIIPIITHSINNPDLVEIAVNLLYDLSFSELGGIDILLEINGIECLHEVIKKYIDNSIILSECLKTLSRAYSKSDNNNRIKILKIGSLDLVMNYYNSHMMDVDYIHKIEDALKTFTSYQIPYFTPSNTQIFSSLKEICASKILNSKNNSTNLPADLQSYLQLSTRCSNCQSHHFKQQYESITIKTYSTLNFTINLPTYNQYCSSFCLQIEQANTKI